MRIGYAGFLLVVASAITLSGQPAIENGAVKVELDAKDLTVHLTDKQSGVVWTLGAPHVVHLDKRTVPVVLNGEIAATAKELSYRTTAGLEFRLAVDAESGSVDYSFRGSLQPFAYPEMDEVDLFRSGLAVGPGPDNYYALPYRLGIQVRPEGDQPFARRMPAYLTSRGYSMSMMGAVKDGSALLVTWDAPYTDVLIDYSGATGRELTAGLALRATARSARLKPLGRGGYVEVAKAFREIARQRGMVQTMAEKMKANPAVQTLPGAADFKPFTLLKWAPNTSRNKTNAPVVNDNFSFVEAGALAEHFQKDLGIDRAMFVIAGWINGGYDGTHPDVLPAAPESGGDAGLAALSRRVKSLGYLFGLHDNYTDFYRAAPSWNEDYIAKGEDGSLVRGGIWAGGQAYLICQSKSLELAQRKQNMPGVLSLFTPDVYFIDCLYAMPPRVCQDPKHPITKADDLTLRNDLADYSRNQHLLFGSEEGNETGVAHADYFEGILSHKTSSHAAGKDTVIPLFELVFGDAVPLLTHQSDRLGPDNPDQLLDHILYAEMPVYRFGVHRYWKDPAQDFKPASGTEAKLVFAQGEGWGLYDRFIKNSYEVLSPLNRLTATLPMTNHRFLTPDRSVEQTVFADSVEITVNYGADNFVMEETVLPRYGFLIKSPTLVAFYASKYGRVSYSDPALFVLRSLDGQPLSTSGKVAAYHGFGNKRLDLRGEIVEVKESSSVFSSAQPGNQEGK